MLSQMLHHKHGSDIDAYLVLTHAPCFCDTDFVDGQCTGLLRQTSSGNLRVEATGRQYSCVVVKTGC